MHLNQVIQLSNFPQRENRAWIRLGRERWKGTHSREGVLGRWMAAGQLEWPVAGEEEEETEELDEQECVSTPI